MPTDYQLPGGMNTYVPTLELSGSLIVDYARNLDKFPVTRYSRVTPVKQVRGAFLQFDPLALARLGATPAVNNDWPAGSLRPTGFDNNLGFRQQTFQTSRKNFGKTLDKRAVDLANWPIMKAHSDALAQEAMTHRAWRVANTMFDSTNYDSTHVVSATTASGTGFLSGGTTGDPRIKNAFDYAARLIMQDTMGRVQFGGLSVLMNHNTALRLSSSRELREYLMQSATAREDIILRKSPINAAYGLPSVLYNYNVIVENTFYNGYNRNATGATGTVVVPDNKLLVFLADGPQETLEGAPSYNTCHVFAYEEMTVETNEDTRNRLVYLDVVMDYDVKIVAPPTAVMIENLFS
jgi:hypothetical protein